MSQDDLRAEHSTSALIELIVGTSPAALPASVGEAARRSLVDTVGVMLAASRTEIIDIIETFASRRGVAHVDQLLLSGPPDATALVYGCSAHALDYDDGLPGAVHPSASVLAAALALGARLGTPELLDAFIIGWEVTARLSRALGDEHYRAGWHTTGTAGVFGAAAAAARFLRLDRHETGMALGIVASQAAGLRHNFGSMTKALHCGLASRAGVTAAELAQLGLTSHVRSVRGFLDIYGRGGAKLSELSGREGWALVSPGAILKAYPCCYAAARGIDAILRLAPRIDVAAIERIDCIGPIGSFVALQSEPPTTGLEAKFSMAYALGAALLDGPPRLASFTDAAVERPRARELVARTTVREEARCRPEDPDGTNSSPVSGGYVEVSVTLTDGTRRTERVSIAHGAPQDPLTEDEIEAKFLDCGSAAGLPEPDVRALLALVRGRR